MGRSEDFTTGRGKGPLDSPDSRNVAASFPSPKVLDHTSYADPTSRQSKQKAMMDVEKRAGTVKFKKDSNG